MVAISGEIRLACGETGLQHARGRRNRSGYTGSLGRGVLWTDWPAGVVLEVRDHTRITADEVEPNGETSGLFRTNLLDSVEGQEVPCLHTSTRF
jgi:hypothetical protein